MSTLLKFMTALALTLACQAFAGDGDDGNTAENVKYLPISQVPERVMATVKAEKPQMYITSASKQLWGTDETYYVVYGSQVGRFWVVTVRADGTLHKVDEEGEPRQKPD